MDLSKLPRLSESPQPPKPAELPATPMGDAGASAGRNAAGRGAHSDIRYAQPPEPGVAAEVWIAAFLGIIFVAMGFRFVRWATATVSGQTFDTQTTWTTGPNAGQMVNYWDLAGYSAYTDMAVFLFGLAVLFEAAVLALVRGTAVWQQTLLLVALVVAATATVVNLAQARSMTR